VVNIEDIGFGSLLASDSTSQKSICHLPHRKGIPDLGEVGRDHLP
jgi:hypothetical protein